KRFLHKCLCSGVEWMPATRFLEQLPSGEETIVRLENESDTRWVRTRFLIGADGSKSRVAAALGLDLNREWIVGVEGVLEGVPLEGPPRFDCFLDPRLAPGYLAWLVHDGEQIHLGVGGYPSRFDPVKTLRDFRSSLSGIVNLRDAKLIE